MKRRCEMALMRKCKATGLARIKRKKLEAAGWKASTVKEFLNLNDADMEFIETKLSLTRALRELF